MMKDMEIGDQVLFYHSNHKPPGIAGQAVISKKAQPDPTQFDKNSNYFDPKSSKESPRWHCVEVKYKKKFKNYISLNDIRENSKLQDMMVIQKGSRLSIQPVTKKEFDHICKIGNP